MSPPPAGGDRRSKGIGRELGAPSPPLKNTHSQTSSASLRLFFATHPYPHPNPTYPTTSSYVCKRYYGNCRTACLATGFILSLGKNIGEWCKWKAGCGAYRFFFFMGVWGLYCNSSCCEFIKSESLLLSAPHLPLPFSFTTFPHLVICSVHFKNLNLAWKMIQNFKSQHIDDVNSIFVTPKYLKPSTSKPLRGKSVFFVSIKSQGHMPSWIWFAVKLKTNTENRLQKWHICESILLQFQQQ